jgi:hypothetical protein
LREKLLLQGLEAEVTERLQQLSMAAAENRALKLQTSVLQATLRSKDEAVRFCTGLERFWGLHGSCVTTV